MDLASMIAEASVEAFKTECIRNTCSIRINLHSRYNYDVSITPMNSHILVRYKTLEYKIPRADKDSYNEVVDFLSEAIDSDCDNTVNSDIEFNGLWPDNEEFWDQNTIRVHRNDEQVFEMVFNREKLVPVLKNYMQTLRMLN